MRKISKCDGKMNSGCLNKDNSLPAKCKAGVLNLKTNEVLLFVMLTNVSIFIFFRCRTKFGMANDLKLRHYQGGLVFDVSVGQTFLSDLFDRFDSV